MTNQEEIMKLVNSVDPCNTCPGGDGSYGAICIDCPTTNKHSRLISLLKKEFNIE
ncbi:MAG: hypothetical protein KAS32_29385 [Candidatus Peribacteraceae bacterium]|nr:hypothetical protein [Candidatus Peribacteraceae bacterium]